MRRRTRVSIGVLVGFAGVLITLWFTQWRSDTLRDRIVRTLSARFNADVTLDDLSITMLPRPRVSGTGLRLNVKERPDLPPFIAIERFWMDLGPFSIVRRHVNTVHVDGLKITMPPKDARRTLGSPDQPGEPHADDDAMLNPSKVIIEKLISHNAVLTFAKKRPDHRPLVFEIESLELEQLGFDRVVPFRAQLVNPVPTGAVQTRGTFGPWVKDDPAETPVSGEYRFSDADLSTIDGISGTLTSSGSYRGRITAIDVTGTTTTPDFNLELKGSPLPLNTTFSAEVDGTNGSVLLRQVDATLGRSTISARGSVVNLPGPGHHDTDLQVAVTKGRIEDLLALVAPGTPAMRGDVALTSTVKLPPGSGPELKRLALDGRFTLNSTTFKQGVQTRITDFSRRAQAKNVDEMDASVASNLKGTFSLANGVMSLRNLSFQVPGANVTLGGTANLRSRALDLRGTLQMQASVSQAVGGFKSIFLKIVDPFFRKPGKGTVLPIKIEGTIDAPKAGLALRSGGR
jgi:hypothetical protein